MYTTYAQLPEEHRMVYEMCRKFADEELAPNAGRWDKEHAFPTAAIAQLVRTVDNQNRVKYMHACMPCKWYLCFVIG